MLTLPITPAIALSEIVRPALSLLPNYMSGPRAEVMLLSIMQQESGLSHRWQVIDPNNPGKKGPARGLAQFEIGSKAASSGVWGVYLHHATHELLRLLCRDRDCNFDPYAIWLQLEHDDVLATAIARLLLYTDAFPLPDVSDERGAWLYYLRNWRPGKPHPETWPTYHRRACDAVADLVK